MVGVIIVEYNLSDLNHKDPKVKYRMQKKIIQLACSNPFLLYKDFDFFVGLLSNKNNIMVWTGLLVLGNLSRVDVQHRIGNVLPIIVSKLNVGKMITAGNAMKALILIIQAGKENADELATALLKSAHYQYDTDECLNIHIGHLISSIGMIWELLSRDVQMQCIQLAYENLNNSRSATAKKARLFLKRYQ